MKTGGGCNKPSQGFESLHARLRMFDHIKIGDIVLVKDADIYERKIPLDLIGRILRVAQIDKPAFHDRTRTWIAFDELITYRDTLGVSTHNAWPLRPDDLEVMFTT